MPNILIKNPLTKQTMQPQAYPLCQAALTQLCSQSVGWGVFTPGRGPSPCLWPPAGGSCFLGNLGAPPGPAPQTSKPRATSINRRRWGEHMRVWPIFSNWPANEILLLLCAQEFGIFMLFFQTFSYMTLMQHLSGGSLATCLKFLWLRNCETLNVDSQKGMYDSLMLLVDAALKGGSKPYTRFGSHKAKWNIKCWVLNFSL